MYYIGIDIGSTASKVAVMEEKGYFNGSIIVATGYGRVSVPYANKTVTEITCHGKGTSYLLGEDCTVIDIGGQDTKVITVENGNITAFTMNDKCAAGTERFLELMANTLGLDINEMSGLSKNGSGVTISSMCTVFAESEVISLIGNGESRENIAHGVIESITSRVCSLCQKHGHADNYFLSGGLCDNENVIESLSVRLGKKVKSNLLGRYAGAIGAAIVVSKIKI